MIPLTKQTFVIVIAGASGSGKSSLARNAKKRLQDWYKVAVVAEDAYYKSQSGLTLQQREQTNYDHPDAIEETLLVEHLRALKNRESVSTPVYDYAIHDRSKQTVQVGPCDVLIVEGILLLHRPSVLQFANLSVFVDVPESVCLERRVKRDIAQRGRTREGVLAQYKKTVGPMYRQFVKPSVKNADLVLKNEREHEEAVEKLLLEVSARIVVD